MALRTYLTGIADAIREKKGTSDPINAQDFASEISSISTGGGGDNPLQALVDGKGGYYLCANYTGTTANFLSSVDFSQATTTERMFEDCVSLTTIPQIDTSNVTTMNYMFSGCHNLRSIPALDTHQANMTYMFYHCHAITTVPQLTVPPSCDMNYMFAYCYNLPTIDVTRFMTIGMSNFSKDCHSLTKLIIRTIPGGLPKFGSNMFTNCYHMSGTVDAIYNPEGLQDGRIYVPDDQVDALKAKTGWSEFADIIVPLSTLVED